MSGLICTRCILGSFSASECEKDDAKECSRWSPPTPSIPRRSALEIVQERSEDLRSALSTLHEHVVYYLASRDLDVDDLPDGSPLRDAIERARDLI